MTDIETITELREQLRLAVSLRLRAQTDLSAHEAEIKELVTKARALEERAVIVNRNGVNDAELDRLIFEVRAALAKVKP